MSNAARRLGITQSAVSQQIAALERALGVVLIDRRVRPVAPTAAGRSLVERATGLLRQGREVSQLVRQAAGNAMPRLRIAMVDSVASTLAPDVLQVLNQEVRNCSIWSGLSGPHAEALMARRVDLIVSIDALESMDGLEKHEILSESYILALNVAASAPRDLGALSRASHLVRYSDRSVTGQDVERYLRRLGLDIPRRLECDGSDTVLAMVAARLGWALTTPLCTLQASRHLHSIRLAPLPGPPARRRLSVVSHAGELGTFPRRLAAALRHSARQHLLAHARSIGPWAEAAVRIRGEED